VKKRLATLIAAVAAACAPRAPRPIVHPVAEDCAAADDQAAATHWAARDDETEVRAALDAWWRAASACPADPERYLAIARAAHFLAEGHLAMRDERGDDYVAHLADGAGAADRGLAALSPRWAELRAGGVSRGDAAAVLDARAAPLLYWWANDTILAANAQGVWATMKVFVEVRTVMERVAALDPAYWHGGADRFLGAFFASAPPIAGGDLERARVHLDAAVARAPEFLENYLVYAVVYARTVKDEDLYRALLETVVAASPSADPDVAIEQTITQEKARRLL
jgi:hypothetical protein